MNEPIDDRLRHLADDVDPARPAVAALGARSTRRRRRHRVVGLAVGVVVACTALLVLPTDEDRAAELDVVGSTTAPTSPAADEVAVPDLRGRSIAEAQALAATLGFEVVANEEDDPAWDATVLAQEPGGEGGTVRVPVGSIIGVRTIAGSSTVWDCPVEQEIRRMRGMLDESGPAPTEVPPGFQLKTVRQLVDRDRDAIAEHFGASDVLVGRHPFRELAAPSGDELRDDAYAVLVVVDVVADCPTTRGEPVESRKVWEKTPVWAVYRRPAGEIQTRIDAIGVVAEPPTVPLPRSGGHAVAWTGDELIVLGGTGVGVPDPTNAAFDPERKTWRSLPPAPRTRSGGFVFWTGTEVLVLGGSSEDLGPSGIDALDPATGEWRTLSSEVAGGIGGSPVDAVWTGDRLVVWSLDNPTPVAIDPDGGRWTALPPLDLATDDVALHWTGSQLVALGRRGNVIEGGVLELDGPGRTIGDSVDGASWRRTEPLASDFGEAGGSVASDWQSVLVGDRILLLHTSWSTTAAAVLDPPSGAWTPVEEPPLKGCSTTHPPIALGDAVVAVSGCSSAAVLMSDQRQWSGGTARQIAALPTEALWWSEAEIATSGTTAWFYASALAVGGYSAPTVVELTAVPTS